LKNPPPAELEGEAVLCKYNEVPVYSDPGGGMSASENRMVNYKGRVMGDPGKAKSTNHGMDTGKDSTNVIKSYSTTNTEEEVSPSATRQSGNKDQAKTY